MLRLKDFLAQKASGGLIVTQKQRQLEEALRLETLSESPDGLLRFNQKVTVLSHQSKGVLSVNPHDEVMKDYPSFMLTTSANAQPTVRNTFVILRVDGDDGFEDDVVHYGQLIRLGIAPFGSKLQGPVYMHSEMVTALAAAKFSRHQEVTALAQPSGETKWQLLCPDASIRLEMEGEPVPAGSPSVFRHVATGSLLASDEIPYDNLFGREMEVHCFVYQSLGKTQNLVGEKKGEITADVALRKQGLPNIWTIRTATHDGQTM